MFASFDKCRNFYNDQKMLLLKKMNDAFVSQVKNACEAGMEAIIFFLIIIVICCGTDKLKIYKNFNLQRLIRIVCWVKPVLNSVANTFFFFKSIVAESKLRKKKSSSIINNLNCNRILLRMQRCRLKKF